MPLQNRVDPFSRLHVNPMRGMFTGNRGCLHDETGRLVTQGGRQDAWVTCALSFRDRRRALMEPGRYTHLFFLDEATALAAGHRPCAECRRADYNAFCGAVARVTGARPSANDLNAALGEEVLASRRGDAWVGVGASSLPVGAMFATGKAAWLRTPRGCRAWSFEGYGEEGSLPGGLVRRLTPGLSVAALEGGFSPVLHASVRDSAA